MKYTILFLISLSFISCAKYSHIKYSYDINKTYTTKIPSFYTNEKPLFKTKNDANLELYLDEVVKNNNNLKVLRLTKKSLQKNISIVRAGVYPSGSLSVNYIQTKESLNEEFSSSVGTNIVMNWDLDIWEKLSDEISSSTYEYEGTQNRYLEERRILILNATIDWINYWYLSQLLKNQDLLLDTYSKLETHYLEESQSGLSERFFYLDARRAKESVQSAVFEISLNLIKLRQQLNIYRGNKSDAPLLINSKESIIPIFLDTKNLNLSSIYLGERYDVRSAFAIFNAFVFSEKASYKALLPQINFSISGAKSSKTISKIFSGDVIWELIDGVTQPIFHSNQLLNIAKEKSIQSEMMWLQYQESILQAYLEIESAVESDKSLKKKLKHKEEFYSHLQDALEISKQKAMDGIFSFSDYLQEEATTLYEKNNLLEVKTEYIKNRLRLMSAIGLPIIRNTDEK